MAGNAGIVRDAAAKSQATKPDVRLHQNGAIHVEKQVNVTLSDKLQQWLSHNAVYCRRPPTHKFEGKDMQRQWGCRNTYTFEGVRILEFGS